MVVVLGEVFRIDGDLEVFDWCLLLMYGNDVMFCLISVVGGCMLMIFVLFG